MIPAFDVELFLFLSISHEEKIAPLYIKPPKVTNHHFCGFLVYNSFHGIWL